MQNRNTKIVSVSFVQRDLAYVRQQAKALGLTLSAYLRILIQRDREANGVKGGNL